MSRQPRFRWTIVALLSMLLPLLIACGGGTTDGANTTPGATAPANGAASNATVTLPFLSGGVTSFDHAYWTSQLLISQGTIFEGLFGYDANLNIVPKVAESATPNADNTVWTIKMRQDKKWSNGDPVTAKDYYGAWMRFMDASLADAPMWAGFFQYVKNGWAFKSGAVAPEEVGIKLVDDYTLEITLVQGVSALPSFLVLSSSMPINAKSLAEHPTDWWDPANAVYNGPYVVKQWVNGGDVTLSRNANYVGDGIGNVGTIILKPYSDANARLQDFENGAIHFSFIEDASQYEYAQNNPLFKDNLHEELSLNWDGIQYSRSTADGPWSDVRVRKAFAMAIDKDTITAQILRGLAQPTSAFSGDSRVTDGFQTLPYDVEGAKKLLAEAGFPNGDGFPDVTFYAPPANAADMPVIEAIAKMWQDNLGVKVTIQNNETAVYSTLQWSNVNPDVKPGYMMMSGPLNWFEPMALLEGSDHIWYFMDLDSDWKTKTAEFDDLIAAAPNTAEVGDWEALAKRAETTWALRQELMKKEAGTPWGEVMQRPPSFMENFEEITARFEAASTPEDKLNAYKDGLITVLREEQSTQEYAGLTENNIKARRLMETLRISTMDEAYPIVKQIQQLGADSAWMVPLYVRKLMYVTDPHLSGVVLNKLSWGGIFQFQYLQWTE